MAIEEDTESCGSIAVDSLAHANPRHQRQKLDVYNEVLKRIEESKYEEANLPGFDNRLWLHFNRLPARYQVYPVSTAHSVDSVHSDSSMKEDAQSAYHSNRQGVHPPPTFGSSPNLEAIALQASRYHVEDGDSAVNSTSHLFRSAESSLMNAADDAKYG
ncbi:hypothetical protein QQP08_002996 [Theobroma cacao]|nr:hypothetical protein QQP08_002996 [Theobroma cacao]